MNNYFQLTQDDIDRSSTLEQDDLGKWCYVHNGCISGFYDYNPNDITDLLMQQAN